MSAAPPGATPSNPRSARSSTWTNASITRTGLLSSIQSSRHSGNNVDCPRSAPTTKRFIKPRRKSRGEPYQRPRFHTPWIDSSTADHPINRIEDLLPWNIGAQDARDVGPAREASALQAALHADERIVAQSRRAVLRRDHDEAHPARHLRERGRVGGRDP